MDICDSSPGLSMTVTVTFVGRFRGISNYSPADYEELMKVATIEPSLGPDPTGGFGATGVSGATRVTRVFETRSI